MPEFRPLCGAAELGPGKARAFEVAGRCVALFNVEGRFHAMENVCLHAGGPLAEGTLEGCVVTCPWHEWQFDVTTGRTPLNPRIALDCYPVRVRDGVVEVLI